MARPRISPEYRRRKHSVHLIAVHLVFVAKYRRAVFTTDMIAAMRVYAEQVCAKMGAECRELGGENDHIHLLVDYPPTLSVSKLVNSLKGVSSRLLRRDFKERVDKFYWKGVLWTPSYFAASCGGVNINAVKCYIENQ